MFGITECQHLKAFWRGELAMLHRSCVTAAPAAEAELLAMGVATLAIARDGMVTTVPAKPCPARIAKLSDAGAGLCTVLELMGGQAGYMLSCSGGGRVLASVFLPGTAGEVTAEGASPTLAMLAAYCAALLKACGGYHGAAMAHMDAVLR